MSIKGQNILEENSSVASNNVPKFSGELYVKNVHKSFGVTKALNDVCKALVLSDKLPAGANGSISSSANSLIKARALF